MVIDKPWPDCGCPLSINFKPATYDRVPFPHSCGISKDEYHRHYICDHEVYLTLSASKINTTTGQWVAKRLKEGRLFVIRGPPRPKPKKKVPAWKVHLRSLSGKLKNSVIISLIYWEVFPGVNRFIWINSLLKYYCHVYWWFQPTILLNLEVTISHQQTATLTRMRYWFK